MKPYININKQAYYQSMEWKQVADTCKNLAGNKCSRCDNTEQLHAHHITYDRLGNELQSDLICLCHTCHLVEHGVEEFTPQYKQIKGGFNMMYHKSYEEVTEQAITSNKDLKLFNWVTNQFTYVRVESPIVYSVCPIEVSQPKFSKFIKLLLQLKYIKRIARGIYRLNPFIYVPFRADASALQAEWKSL